MNKKILGVTILGLVILSVSFSGCIWPPTPPNPDLRMDSHFSIGWHGGNSGPAGFTVSGQLLGPNAEMFGGRTIVLSGSNDVNWNPPSSAPSVGSYKDLKTQTTTVNGNFAFTLQSKDDRYQLYSVRFDGDQGNLATNAKSTASAVAGYHGLLAAANQLKHSLMRIPNAAFAPGGTKLTLLGTLAAFSSEVSRGQYQRAATTLDSAFLQRMNGYATSGAPDSNDYVRTNLAQYQLYYLSYLGVKDCQWLSGAPYPGQLAGPPSAP
jgi:hypothetical protein